MMPTEASALPVLDGAAPLRQARNSAAFWNATGLARGHEVIRRRSFLAVNGDERSGLRILMQSPNPGSEDLAELTALVRRSGGPVDAEDPFSSADLSHLGLAPRQMPIMLRQPGPAPVPTMDVIRVDRNDHLQTAERIVIEGFSLTRFQPHRPGEIFPPALAGYPGVDLFLAVHRGAPIGACVAVVNDGFGSLYWVATLPDHRSRGVGRALMHASLAHLRGLPVTLTSSRLGKPLYESLGFTPATAATWWS